MLPFLGKAQNVNENILIEAGYTYFNKSFADLDIKYLIDNKSLTISANALKGELKYNYLKNIYNQLSKSDKEKLDAFMKNLD